MFNYRKAFLFELVSNKLHYFLKCFLPGNGLMLFIRLNTVKEFSTSFPCLILHTVNLLLFQNHYSKADQAPSSGFSLWRDHDVPLRDGIGTVNSPCKPWNVWTSCFCWIHSQHKIESPHPSPDHRPHIERKVSLIAIASTRWGLPPFPRTCLGNPGDGERIPPSS